MCKGYDVHGTEMCTRFRFENLKEKDALEDLEVYGRITLKCI